MKTNFTLRTGLLLAFVLALTNMAAQTTGDFRTTANVALVDGTKGMSNPAGWQIYNGTAWVQATYSPVGNYGSQKVKAFSTVTALGSSTLVLSAANPLIRVNQVIDSNASIAVGTVVTAISDKTITLSKPTTAALAAGVTLYFGEEFTASTTGATTNSTTVTLATANTAIVAGMGLTGTGVPAGATVTNVNGATLTLSAAATTTSGLSLKFFTKETTATTTAGSTTITLKAANSLVAVGMDVYSVTNDLIKSPAVVTAVNGPVITISQPVASAYNGLPVQFAFFGTIPNLYINHSTNTVNNSRSYHVGNVFVNDGNSTNAGEGATYSNATLGIGGTATAYTIFMCETLTVAPNATVNIATTTSNLNNNFYITGGIGGNAINNNGVLNLLTSPGSTTTKTNISFSGAGATALSGTGTFSFGTFSLITSGLNLSLAANISINGGSNLAGSILTVNEGKVLTNSTTQFVNSGDIILKSTASGTGSLLSGYWMANVTQQRYLSSKQRGWRLLSNPIARKTFSALASQSNITIAAGFTGEYNSADDTWTSTDATPYMEFQKAYKVFITGPKGESPSYATGPSIVTISNKGTADFGVPGTVTTEAGKYYLVGNPYTAPVSVASILAASTGLSTTVSYYDPTNASVDLKVKAGGYNTKTVSGVAGSATDVVIPAMGAIFVKADSAGTINIPKVAIFTGTPAQNGTYNHKTAQPKVASTNVLKVEGSDGNQTIK